MELSFFMLLSPLLQTAIAGTICFLVTALGAAAVFFFKQPNKKVFACFLALAAGVMIASAIFSLILPALDLGDEVYGKGWLVVSMGFFIGAILIVATDISVDGLNRRKAWFKTNNKKQAFLLFASVTFHNIAEGMAVGVAFASVSVEGSQTTVIGALILALGIAIQNFPEGAGVSLPLYSYGIRKPIAFMGGAFSAIVEPVFAIFACLLAPLAIHLMPFLLALSAGAMVGVTLSELIPDAIKSSKNLAIIFFAIGFVIMMILDVVLG